MSILKVLSAKLDTMTQADRQIAQFIIDHPEQMLTLSSAALAEATGRSQSSVVKFSQKLGYAGYQQLKLAVNKAKAIEWLEEQGIGERKVNYRLRDWLLSRQRFWGCRSRSSTAPISARVRPSVLLNRTSASAPSRAPLEWKATFARRRSET